MAMNEAREAIKHDAAAWLLKLEAGGMTRVENEALVRWLRESPVHVAEMLRATNVHESLERFQLWDKVDTQVPAEGGNIISWDAVEQENDVGTSFLRSHRVGAIAAGLLTAFMGAFWIVAALSGHAIETSRGERRELTLSDGSVVQIDPETRLRLKFSEQSREVVLEQGRAVFRVARDPLRPFSVLAQDTVVRAVGTSFGVEQRETAIKVTVAEGKVAILGSSSKLRDAFDIGHSNAPPAAREAGKVAATARRTGVDEVIMLAQDEQIVVTSSGTRGTVRKVDSQRELAWVRGRLVFERETLAAVVQTFNRYNQMQLRINDAAMAAAPISGVFDASDTESFIAFLRSTIGAQVLRERDGMIVIARGDE